MTTKTTTHLARCAACGARVPGHEFTEHALACPATPPSRKGESWTDYQARAEAFAQAWRAAQKKPSRAVKS